MVTEIATFTVIPGHEDAFAEGFRRARQHVQASEGVGTIRMHRGIESPSTFVLTVEWESVEAHEQFRASERFPRWREPIAPHFAAAPHVEHYAEVV